MASKKDRARIGAKVRRPPAPASLDEANRFVSGELEPTTSPKARSKPALAKPTPTRKGKKTLQQPTAQPGIQNAGRPKKGLVAAKKPRGLVERGGRTKRRITAYLDARLGARVVVEAATRGIEISELVAHALRRFLAD
jgi:hypothetical protein